MRGCVLGQGIGEATGCPNTIPEFLKISLGGFQRNGHAFRLVLKETLNISRYRRTVVKTDFQGIDVRRGLQQDLFAVRFDDALIVSLAKAFCRFRTIARQMDVEGIVAVSIIESTEHPRETVVRLDVLVWVRQP